MNSTNISLKYKKTTLALLISTALICYTSFNLNNEMVQTQELSGVIKQETNIKEEQDIYHHLMRQNHSTKYLEAHYTISEIGKVQVIAISQEGQIMAQDLDRDGQFDFTTYNKKRLDLNNYVYNETLEQEMSINEYRIMIQTNKILMEKGLSEYLDSLIALEQQLEQTNYDIINLYKKHEESQEDNQFSNPIPDIPNLDII